MITEELKNLKKEFERIKKMGYVKATRLVKPLKTY